MPFRIHFKLFNANFKSIQVSKSPTPTTPKTSNVLKLKYENTTVPKGINIKAKNAIILNTLPKYSFSIVDCKYDNIWTLKIVIANDDNENKSKVIDQIFTKGIIISGKDDIKRNVLYHAI